MNAKRPRSGDLHLLPTISSPREENSGAHSISSPPPRRMDWSNLGEGPSGMIAERLLANDVTDYVRFRAVCRPWRQCTADPRAHGTLDRRFLPRRWIMLREKAADPDCCRLLNVSTGQCVRAHLPELRGHDVCSPTVEGLLVLLNWSTYVIRLLNPLTRQVADLPPATTLYSLYWRAGTYDAYPRLDFEVSGAGLAGDGTVAASMSKCWPSPSRVTRNGPWSNKALRSCQPYHLQAVSIVPPTQISRWWILETTSHLGWWWLLRTITDFPGLRAPRICWTMREN